jgi:competence protein ComEC
MYNPFIFTINQILPEPQAGLLNGILFGTKANLPKDFYQNLITTGTIHIIALSGQNIAILTRLISDVTIIFGRKISGLLTIFGVIFFVIFVGLEPTIVRAAIMASLSLLSVYFGRQNWSLLGLILAAMTMLVINPAWVTNLSFQLSFLATFGIILFGSSKQSKIKSWQQELLRELKISLKLTLAAQIFTLPVILYQFHRVSIVTPLTNILIGWVIAPIMILGFAVSILGLIFLPIGQLVGFVVWVPLTYLVEVVNLTAKIPFASIKF